jgi:hypothetical protein
MARKKPPTVEDVMALYQQLSPADRIRFCKALEEDENSLVHRDIEALTEVLHTVTGFPDRKPDGRIIKQTAGHVRYTLADGSEVEQPVTCSVLDLEDLEPMQLKRGRDPERLKIGQQLDE